jgi:uncharacterized sulfatase
VLELPDIARPRSRAQPFIARLPGAFRSGVTEATPVLTTDPLPTFLESAGLEPLEDYPGNGISLAPLLISGAPRQRLALYWYYPAYHHSTPASTVRTG